MNKEERLKTGTTNVAIVGKDFVVIGADRRVTAGHMIMDKDFKKLYQISKNMVVAFSGVVSDVQLLLKYLKNEIKFKEIRLNRLITVKETANLISTWNYSLLRNNYAIGAFLLAGYDKEPSLYSISPDGALMKHEDYYAAGSGSIFAFGVFEANYKSDLSKEKAVDLAEQALNASLQRDSASGNGVDIYLIDKEGVVLARSKEALVGTLNK